MAQRRRDQSAPNEPDGDGAAAGGVRSGGGGGQTQSMRRAARLDLGNGVVRDGGVQQRAWRVAAGGVVGTGVGGSRRVVLLLSQLGAPWSVHAGTDERVRLYVLAMIAIAACDCLTRRQRAPPLPCSSAQRSSCHRIFIVALFSHCECHCCNWLHPQRSISAAHAQPCLTPTFTLPAVAPPRPPRIRASAPAAAVPTTALTR